MTITEIAESFSRHRFAEAYPHLAEDARWVVPGQAAIEGRDAIVAACEGTTSGLAGVTTTFSRFVSITGVDAVAIDVVASYAGGDGDGDTTVVSSCDIYEFVDGTLTTITSYAAELPAG